MLRSLQQPRHKDRRRARLLMDEVFRGAAADSNGGWGCDVVAHRVAAAMTLQVTADRIQDDRQRHPGRGQEPSGTGIRLPPSNPSGEVHQWVDDPLDVLRSSTIRELDEHLRRMRVRALREKVDGNAQQSVSKPRCSLDPDGERAECGRLTGLSDSAQRFDNFCTDEVWGGADGRHKPLLGILVALFVRFTTVEAAEKIEQLSSCVVRGQPEVTAYGLSARERPLTLLSSPPCGLLVACSLCRTVATPSGKVRKPSELAMGTFDFRVFLSLFNSSFVLLIALLSLHASQ